MIKGSDEITKMARKIAELEETKKKEIQLREQAEKELKLLQDKVHNVVYSFSKNFS